LGSIEGRKGGDERQRGGGRDEIGRIFPSARARKETAREREDFLIVYGAHKTDVYTGVIEPYFNSLSIHWRCPEGTRCSSLSQSCTCQNGIWTYTVSTAD